MTETPLYNLVKERLQYEMVTPAKVYSNRRLQKSLGIKTDFVKFKSRVLNSECVSPLLLHYVFIPS